MVPLFTLALMLLGHEEFTIRESASAVLVLADSQRLTAAWISAESPEARDRLQRLRVHAIGRELDTLFAEQYPSAKDLNWIMVFEGWELPEKEMFFWFYCLSGCNECCDRGGEGGLLYSDDPQFGNQVRARLIAQIAHTGDWSHAENYRREQQARRSEMRP